MEKSLKTREQYEISGKDYTEDGLSLLRDVNLLSPENLAKIQGISEELADTYRKTKIWRSETEMRTSVLNDTKFPTSGMKYLQARLEQDVHFRELMYLGLEYEQKQGELLKLEGELEELLKTGLFGKVSKIREGAIRVKRAEIKKCQWNLVEMQKSGHHRVREVDAWERIKKELLAIGGFDPDDYESIQQEGFGIRWQRELVSETESGNIDGDRLSVLRGSLSALHNNKEKRLNEKTP